MIEDGSTWGSWIAYGVIIAFLVLAVLLILRTVLLAGTLLLMPVARALRALLPGRRASAELLGEGGHDERAGGPG